MVRSALQAAALTTTLVAAPLAGTSAAATFTVTPTQLFLGARVQSALLTIRNDSTETLRFQIAIFTWSQSPSGDLELGPTRDVVAFPALLTLAPREERHVRVGRVVGAAEREKTYRIFVEELPPVEATGPAGAGVRVLTRMGVPVFIRPEREASSAALGEVTEGGGMARFTLTNTGTVHFIPQRVMLRGVAAGKPVFEQTVESWYVLAGGTRRFEALLPAASCATVTSLVVEAVIGSSSLQQQRETPQGVCGR